MLKTPPIIRVVSPEAAAYLWRISDARLRRLALDGKLAHATIKGWGRKPCRCFAFDACVERWGSPDPDRLSLLLCLSLLQVTSEGAAVWELYVPRPRIAVGDDDLAVSMPAATGD